MRICIVIPGGLDGQREDRRIPCLQWVVERLTARHSVEVFALRQPGDQMPFSFAGARVHPLLYESFWGAVRRIWASHRKQRFDVVHAFWASRPGAVALVASRIIRRPLFVHVAGGELTCLHDIQYGTYRTRRGKWMVDTVLRRANAVTVASSGMARSVDELGVATRHVPLGVSLRQWPIRKPPMLVEAPYRLIHVASLNRVKNQEPLLRAVARLRTTDFPIQLDIVGVDTLNGALHQLAAELKLLDCVTFHGWKPQADVRRLMSEAHLHLVTSRHEAGPLVVREAATQGVLTIGSPVGHIADWAPTAAITVDPQYEMRFANEIRNILRDDERRVAIATAAQAETVQHDADWTVEQFEAMYEGDPNSR